VAGWQQGRDEKMVVVRNAHDKTKSAADNNEVTGGGGEIKCKKKIAKKIAKSGQQAACLAVTSKKTSNQSNGKISREGENRWGTFSVWGIQRRSPETGKG